MEPFQRPMMPSRRWPPGSGPPSSMRTRSWLILDRIAHRSKKLEGVVERDATASATSHDCVGRPVRASLRVAAAPAVSRLHLHLPDREWVEEIPLAEPMEEPSVIAAHRNSILFKVVVPFKDSEWTDPFLFPVDYFVYSASCSSSSPPSLTRLPACFEGVAPHPEEDKYFHPYRRQRQRVMRVSQLGLLCHSEDGQSFTVADLSPHSYREVELCILHHHAPPPGGVGTATMPSWKVKRLQITPQMRMTGLNLASFTTDVVLPVSRRHLCWVDYYQGMLLFDFQPTGRDQHLSFIPLPSEALRSRRPYIDAGAPDPFRRVSITSAGFINLVCITKSRVHSDSHLDFTIKTWILDISRPKWRKDFGATMKHDEFYSLYEAGKNLPRVMPSFPVVSLVDPDVISFLLKEDDDIFWMIEVNMWYKKLRSSAVYIKEEESEEAEEEQVGGGEQKAGGGEEEQVGGGEGDKGYFSKKVCRIFFDGHYFIPSQFSAYLSEDAVTSWELSDMMQRKVKQRMARQKSRLEAPSDQFDGLKIALWLFLLCIVCFFVLGPSGFSPF
ncbi:unnamed protein product [Urochloa decumbens]|uniref:DUF1618 domain-containing protein n=1 Tax=Urochloa decumbens TaxID=240449 RepID=A0ABC9D7G1_9POAL